MRFSHTMSCEQLSYFCFTSLQVLGAEGVRDIILFSRLKF